MISFDILDKSTDEDYVTASDLQPIYNSIISLQTELGNIYSIIGSDFTDYSILKNNTSIISGKLDSLISSFTYYSESQAAHSFNVINSYITSLQTDLGNINSNLNALISFSGSVVNSFNGFYDSISSITYSISTINDSISNVSSISLIPSITYSISTINDYISTLSGGGSGGLPYLKLYAKSDGPYQYNLSGTITSFDGATGAMNWYIGSHVMSQVLLKDLEAHYHAENISKCTLDSYQFNDFNVRAFEKNTYSDKTLNEVLNITGYANGENAILANNNNYLNAMIYSNTFSAESLGNMTAKLMKNNSWKTGNILNISAIIFTNNTVSWQKINNLNVVSMESNTISGSMNHINADTLLCNTYSMKYGTVNALNASSDSYNVDDKGFLEYNVHNISSCSISNGYDLKVKIYSTCDGLTIKNFKNVSVDAYSDVKNLSIYSCGNVIINIPSLESMTFKSISTLDLGKCPNLDSSCVEIKNISSMIISYLSNSNWQLGESNYIESMDILHYQEAFINAKHDLNTYYLSVHGLTTTNTDLMFNNGVRFRYFSHP